MKIFSTLLFISILLVSCKETPKNTNSEQGQSQAQLEQENKDMAQEEMAHPQSVAQVFNAHGTYAKWNAMQTLSFEMEGRNGTETITTDLKNRMAKVETPKYTMGYDGSDFWLDQDEKIYDPKRVKFTHNLMFYFYAMPFILGDDGITYTDVEPITIDKKTYDGVKISYGEGVGYSAKDNYIIYSDPETHQMKWLAYTATFGGDEKSDKFSFINYSEWQTLNGLILPKTLQWFKVEDGKPTEMRNEMVFSNVSVSENKMENTFYKAPEGTIINE